MQGSSAMTLAERQRQWRDRRRAGVQLVSVEVDQHVIDELVWSGLLDRQDVGNRQRIAEALRKSVTRYVEPDAAVLPPGSS